MVAVGDDGKSVAVPMLRPFSPEEKRRWDAALVRKQVRKELAQRYQQVRLPAPVES